MKTCPLRTSVIGSYPLPGWLELASRQFGRFVPADRAEVQDDDAIATLHDQIAAGLDVVTDGEQTRLDFNLSFYGYIKGIGADLLERIFVIRPVGPAVSEQSIRTGDTQTNHSISSSPMNLRILLVSLYLLVLSALAVLAAPVAAPQNPAGFVIRRGINLSHWLSQDFGWAPRDQWITEKDIRFIAEQGFDHVRLPIDEKELWLPDGTMNEPEFKRLITAIGWCRQAKLRVIVDLHTINSHHFNAANEGLHNTLWTDPAAQEHMVSLWRDLSSQLHHFPADAVAYEILNEPVADNHEDWNKLLMRCYTMLRAAEPNRVIVMGANRWQIPGNLPFLRVPEGDKNIILSFHTYTPMLFTHYKASWVPIKIYTGPVHYPGPIVDEATFAKLKNNDDVGVRNLISDATENWGPARLRQECEPAIRRARELGLQLYCGEFGCIPNVPRADRLAYYRDIVGVFEAEGIAWANWEYKGDFGVFEWRGVSGSYGGPDKELLRTLLSERHP